MPLSTNVVELAPLIVSRSLSGVGLASTFKNIGNKEPLSPAQRRQMIGDTLLAVSTFVELSKKIPIVGTAAQAISLTGSLEVAYDDISQYGKITDGTLAALGSGIIGLGSFLGAGALAGLGAGAAALAAPLAIAGAIAAAGLSIYGLTQEDGDTDIADAFLGQMQELDQFFDSAAGYFDEVGNNISAFLEQAGDSFFFDLTEMGGNWSDLFAIDGSRGMPINVNRRFKSGLNNAVARRDPFVLDLDGDGIETTAADGSVLFDHDGDGIKHATGWISSDDGILVLDRNGNGFIDDGGELFGDNTIKSNGEFAANGYDALADLDSNNDGVIDSQDKRYSELKVWRDLNQDGLSQDQEIFQLGDYNIASINLSYESVEIEDEHDNLIIAQGTFNYADGSSGKTSTAAALDLSANYFFREFSEPLHIPDELQSLPDSKGSGAVRDLREAATLSEQLANLLHSYKTSSGRQQWEMVDQLLTSWADTAQMQTSVEQVKLFDSPQVVRDILFLAPGQSVSDYTRYQNHLNDPSYQPDDLEQLSRLESDRLKLLKAIQITEIFNGERIVERSNEGLFTKTGISIPLTPIYPLNVDTPYAAYIDLGEFSASKLIESYELLKKSLYRSLTIQTRLKPYLDDISMVFNAEGASYNFSSLRNKLLAHKETSLEGAYRDLAEIFRFMGDSLSNMGWFAQDTLRSWIEGDTSNPELQDILSTLHVKYGSGELVGTISDDILLGDKENNILKGGEGEDLLDGGEGNDRLSGQEGNDRLHGRLGSDQLYGGKGDDFLDGGAGDDFLYGEWDDDDIQGGDGNDRLYGGGGNDILNGGAGQDDIYGDWGDDTLRGGTGDGDVLIGGDGSDTYLFGIGDGHTRISNFGQRQGQGDVLRFLEGIVPEDIRLSRQGDDLLLTVISSQEVITVSRYFFDDGNSDSHLDAIEFADGTRWDVAHVFGRLLEGSDGDDHLLGYGTDDVLNGGAGNDTIEGRKGNDGIQGGDGNDRLYGGEGNDILNGGAGQDDIYGDWGDDTLRGGTGDGDVLIGGDGSDTYLFGIGDGHTRISNFGQRQGQGDVLRFLEGIVPEDIRLSRQGDDLLLTVISSQEVITVSRYFFDDGNGDSHLDAIKFTDETSWDVAHVFGRLLEGSDGDDHLLGYGTDDVLNGGAGNDTIEGRKGNDDIQGGDGNDRLYGGEGNDILNGGAGQDDIYGDWGDDTLRGGTGDGDVLIGGDGSDTYLFGIGDGHTRISNFGQRQGQGDVLRFLEGIVPEDIRLSRQGDDLLLTVISSQEVITVSRYFFDDGNGDSHLDAIKFTDETSWDVAHVFGRLLEGSDGDDHLLGYGTDDVLNGGAGNDTIEGRKGNDDIQGGDGNDRLYGEEGNDILNGGAGQDDIYGDWGDDQLTGGLGNDWLSGGTGSDTYIFGRAHGQDTLSDYVNNSSDINRVQFTDGINSSDIELVADPQDGYNLLLKIKNTSDQIKIRNWFTDSSSSSFKDKLPIQQLVFADGTIWSVDDIKNAFFDTTNKPTEGNDQLTGTELADEIYGLGGDDIIDGLGGDDKLYGQAGNDTLSSSGGDALLDGGEGNDTLKAFSRSNNVLKGGAGDDVLELVNDDNKASAGFSNRFEGGTGNDTITSYHGSDSFVFNRGDGVDTITDFGGNDTLVLGAGISKAHLSVSRDGNDMLLVLLDDSGQATGDSIRIKHAINNATTRIEQVQFADGTSLSGAELLTMALSITGTQGADNLTGTIHNDTILGLGGDDTLYGLIGDDVLDGGEGNDTLKAFSRSNNVLKGGAGDDVLELVNDDNKASAGFSNRFEGGTGNDTITSYHGSDSFVFNRGDGVDTITDFGGNDTLVLGAGISKAHLSVSRDGNDMLLVLLDDSGQATGDSIRIKHAINNATTRIEQVQFADGTSLSGAELLTMALSITGTQGADNLTGTIHNDTILGLGGDDTLYGLIGDDVLDGGEGNDTLKAFSRSNNVLKGGAGDDVLELVNDDNKASAGFSNRFEGGTGNDTITSYHGSDSFVFNRGDGVDTITDFGGNDTLVLGAGISKAHLSVSRDGNDMLLVLLDDSGQATGDSIRIKHAINNATTRIEQVQFADGTSLSGAELLTMALSITGTQGADNLTGTIHNDTILGLGGDDTLYGLIGDDVLDGGEGNDTLKAFSRSNNVLKGGAGDDVLELVNDDNKASAGFSNRFEGGTGNDTITSYHGSDSFVFNRGDGVDTITDFGGNDTLVLGAGISKAHLSVSRDGNDMLLVLLDDSGQATGDSIRIKRAMDNESLRVETVQFADGDSLDWQALVAMIPAEVANSPQSQQQQYKANISSSDKGAIVQPETDEHLDNQNGAEEQQMDEQFDIEGHWQQLQQSLQPPVVKDERGAIVETTTAEVAADASEFSGMDAALEAQFAQLVSAYADFTTVELGIGDERITPVLPEPTAIETERM